MALYDDTRGVVQSYTAAAATDFLSYPDKNQVSILGPVWLPKVYGKDLTSFEIASSGSIAITIQDIHSFDLTRDNGFVSFAAQSNDGFLFTTGDSNVSVKLDKTAQELDLYAASAAVLNTSNLTLAASNIYMQDAVDYAVFFGKSDSNITLTSSNNLVLTASNTVALRGQQVLFGGLGGTVGLENLDAYIHVNSNWIDFYAGQTQNHFTSNSEFFWAKSNINLSAGKDAGLYAEERVEIASASSNAFVQLDGTASNMTFFAAADQLHFTSNSELFEVAQDFGVQAGKDIALHAADAFKLAAGASNVVIAVDAATASLEIHAQSNFTTLLDGGAYSLVATQGDVTLNAGDRAKIVLDNAASNIEVLAGASISAAAHAGDIFETAKMSADIWAAGSNLHLSLSNDNTVYLTALAGGAVVSAQQEIAVTSTTKSIAGTAATDLSLSANAGKQQLVLDSVAGATSLVNAQGATEVLSKTGLALWAAGSNAQVLLNADQTLAIAATKDVSIFGANSNVEILFQDATKGLVAGALGPVQILGCASNAFVQLVDGALTAAATKSVTLWSSSSNVEVQLTDTTQSLFMGAAADVDLWAAASNVHVSLSKLGSISATASNGVAVTAQNQGITLNAKTDIAGAAGNDVTFAASNVLSAYGGAEVEIAASSNVSLDLLASAKTLTAKSDTFQVKASDGISDMVKVVHSGGNNIMTLYGQLDILGPINSIDVTQTNLEVNDKVIRLAFGTSNDDMLTNDDSGIMVMGLPDATQAANADYVAANEKSLKWYKNVDGTPALGTEPGLSTEAFWEMRGGSFRLTNFTNATDFLSFAFRIGARNELELVKINSVGGTATHKVIGRFGRTLI